MQGGSWWGGGGQNLGGSTRKVWTKMSGSMWATSFYHVKTARGPRVMDPPVFSVIYPAIFN